MKCVCVWVVAFDIASVIGSMFWDWRLRRSSYYWTVAQLLSVYMVVISVLLSHLSPLSLVSLLSLLSDDCLPKALRNKPVVNATAPAAWMIPSRSLAAWDKRIQHTHMMRLQQGTYFAAQVVLFVVTKWPDNFIWDRFNKHFVSLLPAEPRVQICGHYWKRSDWQRRQRQVEPVN